MITVLIYFLLGATVLYYIFVRRRPNFPPGPTPLPLLGNLLSFSPSPHVAFVKWQKEYGPIVGMQVAMDPAIVVSGHKLIREALNEPVMAGRETREAFAFLAGDANGIVQSVGEHWAEQRRFALRSLRDFGFGKSSMEELILEEVTEFIDWLKKKKGEPVDLQRRFSLAVVNSLWKILTGERYSHDDKKLVYILDEMERAANGVLGFQESPKSLLIFFYPKIAKLFPNWSGWNKIVETSKPRMELFDQIVREHKDTMQEGSPRDFIDIFLEEVRKTEDPNSSFNPRKSALVLRSIMSDFFTAGSDTTSVTLTWTILYLLHSPRVQQKLREELDRVVGRTRLPALADRKNLPYVEAVMMETLRISSIAPFGVPHSTMEDIKFHGYDIPKGTVIFPNLYLSHHDPEIWGDPEVYRPDRFISPDGTTVLRNEALIPFSVGKRVCLGETLARDTLFLFIACLAQNFEMCAEPGAELPKTDIQYGQLTLGPHKFEISMKERL